MIQCIILQFKAVIPGNVRSNCLWEASPSPSIHRFTSKFCVSTWILFVELLSKATIHSMFHPSFPFSMTDTVVFQKIWCIQRRDSVPTDHLYSTYSHFQAYHTSPLFSQLHYTEVVYCDWNLNWLLTDQMWMPWHITLTDKNLQQED